MSNPKRFNSNHFTTEIFPEIIGFCERDETTHIVTDTDESYQYTLNGETIYTLKKYAAQWELLETKEKKVIRVSTGRSLGLVLTQGLRFTTADKKTQEERVSILFPVASSAAEKTLAFMYYFGGYPNNFITPSAELDVITQRFVGADFIFFSYSYVPIIYLDWLQEELKKSEIIQDGADKTLWVYKK